MINNLEPVAPCVPQTIVSRQSTVTRNRTVLQKAPKDLPGIRWWKTIEAQPGWFPSDGFRI